MKDSIQILENYLDHFAQKVDATKLADKCLMLTKHTGTDLMGKHQISVTNSGSCLVTIRIVQDIQTEISASLSIMESGRRKVTVEASTNYFKQPNDFDKVVRDFAPALDELIQEFKTKYKL